MTEVVRTVRFAGSSEDAYRAWLDTEQLARWWWPMFPDTSYHLDERVGGAFRFETADAGFGVRGEYGELVPGKRLVCTWQWLDAGTDSGSLDRVTVTFTPDGDSTLVRVVHRTEPGAVDDYEAGWDSVLGRLGDPVHESA